VIFASDETHLTNFSGDKKAWPIYMTLGNLPSATRNAPTSEAMYLVALLPIPPKKKKLKQRQKDQIEKILQECLYNMLLPLAKAADGPVEIDCCDSK
jgi:Plavaka transposase